MEQNIDGSTAAEEGCS